MKYFDKPVSLALLALALPMAACTDEGPNATAASVAQPPATQVKADAASVEDGEKDTVVRAGDVSVSISNSK